MNPSQNRTRAVTNCTGCCANCRADKALDLLTAAKSAFTEGLAIAAGVGSALLLASAVAVWLLLKPRSTPPSVTEVGALEDPGMHRDPGGDPCVDAAGAVELADRHC